MPKNIPLPKMLAAAGPALYGERWQSEIGRALGVTDRTVRRWAAGETAPDDIRPKVLEADHQAHRPAATGQGSPVVDHHTVTPPVGGS